MGRCHSFVRGAILSSFLLASLVAFSQDKTFDRNGQKEKSGQLELQNRFQRGGTLNGQSAAELLSRAQSQKMQLRKNASSQESVQSYVLSGLKWKNLGPAPLADPAYGYVSGRAAAVAVDPTDPTGNTVYVGGAFGGLWRSTNASATDVGDVVWSQLLDSAPTLSVGAVAVKPDNGKVLLVGTGEASGVADAYYGLGILRSEDGGATWTQISDAAPASGSTRLSFKGAGFSRIAFSSQNTNLVVAAASRAYNSQGLISCSGCVPGWGLYYSNDAGKTWTQAVLKDGSTTVASSNFNSVVFNPTDKLFYASVAYHGLYSSSDGVTFTRLAAQPLGAAMDTAACPVSQNVNCPLYRAEMAVRPDSSKGELYVSIVNEAGADRGIYVTRDSGSTWTALDESGINNCGDSIGCGTMYGLYAMSLAAVPNGNGTDLYVGSGNVYKCTINAQNPVCATSPFANLTHSYGSGTPRVHPAQHGIDYSASNPNIVYVANDGGIYRSLNGTFHNLNATIGSMTQLFDFSQPVDDDATLLAGTANNGSASTNASAAVDRGLNGLGWSVYANGNTILNYAGRTVINPTDSNEWFVSAPADNGTGQSATEISRCTQGVNCKGQFTKVIDAAVYGGDATAFPMPFILDPNATDRMILGTCRVWRGSSNPTASWGTALSPNFTTGDSTGCVGGSTHRMITSIAAGGPKVDGVGSQVIYAGDELGRIYVTKNANGSPATWNEVTSVAQGKPVWGTFPVSSIVIASADGSTAYITVQGFNNGAGHVFKTVDAGATWTNLSGTPANGGLPDAPANTIAFDPVNPGVIYVGTDVGVFMTADGGAHWAEYGPASGAGSLPNVPVTKLEAINTQSVHKLRASTYGRGLWEIDLASYKDFTQTVTPDTAQVPVKVSNGGTTTFTVNYAALGAFNADIKVACADLPDGITCTYNPETVGSTASSSLVTVKLDATKVAASTQPIAFKITGTAGDVTKTSTVRISVTDFAMAATTTTGTVKAGNSASYSVGISSDTGHLGSVVLTCSSGLPDKASCDFAPASIGPGASSILTIKTTAATTAMLKAPSFGTGAPLFAVWFGLPGMVLAGGAVTGKRKKAIVIALLAMMLISIVAMSACGGSKSSTPTPISGTPAGTYTVTVTGTSGALTHTTTVTLVVQ